MHDCLCNFVSQLSHGQSKSPPCSYRWGAEARLKLWLSSKLFVNLFKLVTLIAMFNNFTFRFSQCRPGLLSFSLWMYLPFLILFHQVTFSSKTTCKYTEQRRKKGRKPAHISHLPGHSRAQPQGTGRMSWTIRVNDKSDVVHSLGKHLLHKRTTGRQTLTCPKLITHVEANTQTHTHTCTHLSLSICWDSDGNLPAQNDVSVKIGPDSLRRNCRAKRIPSHQPRVGFFMKVTTQKRNARDLCLFVQYYCAMWSVVSYMTVTYDDARSV